MAFRSFSVVGIICGQAMRRHRSAGRIRAPCVRLLMAPPTFCVLIPGWWDYCGLYAFIPSMTIGLLQFVKESAHPGLSRREGQSIGFSGFPAVRPGDPGEGMRMSAKPLTWNSICSTFAMARGRLRPPSDQRGARKEPAMRLIPCHRASRAALRLAHRAPALPHAGDP